jgi:hypothetical protein
MRDSSSILNVDHFWQDVRQQPAEDQQRLILAFANLIIESVEQGSTSLRDAGIALAPAVTLDGIPVDLWVVGDRAEDLYQWGYQTPELAADFWADIVTLIRKHPG